MKVKDFTGLFAGDPLVQLLLHELQPGARVQARGLTGSLDAVVATALAQARPVHQLYILHDRDEASYFANDLENLLEQPGRVAVFPTSYKRPYQFEEVDNANVLQRAELLSRLTNKDAEPICIVTYPEALTDKVINKRSLRENSFTVRVGDKLDTAFLGELLAGYDFERSEFVYEPGQYSLRGGIIDIFSYASDLPHRLELFGDEIESIRTFHPESQLSAEVRREFSIVPDVQTRLLEEVRETLLHFLPKDTLVWIKDLNLTTEVLDKSFEKAEAYFQKITHQGKIQIVSDPEALYDTGKVFKDQLKPFTVIEFGSRFHFRSGKAIDFEGKVQPSFNKDINRLSDALIEMQSQGFTNIISSDNPKQLERLGLMFEEGGHAVRFQPLYIALRGGFIYPQHKVLVYTDHQLFNRFHRARLKEKFSKTKALTLKELKTLQPGDFVTHIDYGVGRFAGLEKVEAGGRMQEAVRLVFRDDDFLFVSIHALHKLSKFSSKDGGMPSLSKLGSGEWEAKKSRVKKKVRDIAKDLIELYAKRKSAQGYRYKRDTFMQVELESSFLYEDTPDQAKAIGDVKQDMEGPNPMDRLVCGDVGFGKTEVALRAAFKAVDNGKQVAVLVPTTILAMQHTKTFKDRLANFPVTIDYINRFKSTKEVNETLKRLQEGKIDILVGTHKLANKDVKFKDLGLLIIDEEQKFGVKVKDRLKEFRVNVDVLTLTATPIPRTLQFSLMGARDLSVIATPPPNRQPVSTEVVPFDEVIIRDAVSYELRRGGQVFFVHNRIGDIEEVANVILRMVPEARVAIAHGQMDPTKLENVMLKFIEGEYDVLVSTNIIESGLDIPNANTIIINRAHMFGLSDLHQMRGRVGRSNRKAYCYLMTVPVSLLTADARKRLQALEEFNELGDGLKVAMRDLDIRGAGDLLGAEQSGFINDVGFDAYHKILDETIQELKHTEFAELFKSELDTSGLIQDCTIETDFELLIPESYIVGITERLALYTQLDSIKDAAELTEFENGLRDRFGPLPKQVQDLIKTVRLRWLAVRLGLEKLTVRDSVMRGTFVGGDKQTFFQSDVFGKVVGWVQNNAHRSRLKDQSKKLMLVVEKVKTVDLAIKVLATILDDAEALATVAPPTPQKSAS